MYKDNLKKKYFFKTNGDSKAITIKLGHEMNSILKKKKKKY